MDLPIPATAPRAATSPLPHPPLVCNAAAQAR